MVLSSELTLVQQFIVSTILVFSLSSKLLKLVIRSSLLFVVFCLTVSRVLKSMSPECHRGSVLGSFLSSLYTCDLPCLLETTLVAYSDNSTLLAEVLRPMDRLSVSASLNRDLARICIWCNSWGMRVNPNKTKFLVISRSRTLAPFFPSFV